MKLITSLVCIAALSFVTSVLAQEAITASPAPEETPSTTIAIEETPTPSPEAKATATPEELPAAQKKEKPAAATTPATTSPAPAKGKKMTVSAMLKDYESRMSAAVASRDTAPFESLVAADFVGVNSKGKVQNRRAMLADIKGDKDTYTSTKAEKLDVHMFGSGLAIVVGLHHEKGSDPSGKPFDRTYRFTDTWVDRGGGNWQLIAAQAMLVAQR